MANISAFAAKAMLDWLCGGATAARPAERWIGLSLGAPTSVTGSEVQANSGYARQTALFGAVSAGSASNTAAMTFGPFSSSAAVQGIHIWDTGSINSGNMLAYGVLNSAITVQPGDSARVSPGMLIVMLE